MKKATAFWDASGLVPLCVHEAASRRARSCLRRFAPVVWWGSLVEVHRAICRLHREAEISDVDKQGAVARLRLLGRTWWEILPGDEVRDLVVRLLDKHPCGRQMACNLPPPWYGADSVRLGEASSAGTSGWPGQKSRMDSQFSSFQGCLLEIHGSSCNRRLRRILRPASTLEVFLDEATGGERRLIPAASRQVP